jgi:hypothetical protein
MKHVLISQIRAQHVPVVGDAQEPAARHWVLDKTLQMARED